MNSFVLQHAKFLSPYYARRTVEVMQETFPLWFKGFHEINHPFYFDAVFAVLKPFLKDKLGEGFPSMDEISTLFIHSFIQSYDILLEEYGGTKPPFGNKKLRLTLLANENNFVELKA